MAEQLYTGTDRDFDLFERADAVIRSAGALFEEAREWFEREWHPDCPTVQDEVGRYGETIVAHLRDEALHDLTNRFMKDHDEPEIDRKAIATVQSLSQVRTDASCRRILGSYIDRHALYPAPNTRNTTGKTPLASILPCIGSFLEEHLDLTALRRARRELLALRIVYVTWLLSPDAHENEELWPHWWRSTTNVWENGRHIRLARHDAMRSDWAALALVAIRICERMVERGAAAPNWNKPGGTIQNAKLAARAGLCAEQATRDLTAALKEANVARPKGRPGHCLIWKYEHLLAAYSSLRPRGKLKKLLTSAGFGG